MKLFSAEDFCDKTTFVDTQGTEHTMHNGMILISWSQAAEYANAKLREWVESAPKIYGVSPRPYEWTSYQVSSELPKGSTHTARLMEITPIEEGGE